MIFYRYNDDRLKDIERVVKKFQTHLVSDLFEGVKSYNALLFGDKQNMDLFEYLLHIF